MKEGSNQQLRLAGKRKTVLTDSITGHGDEVAPPLETGYYEMLVLGVYLREPIGPLDELVDIASAHVAVTHRNREQSSAQQTG